MVLSKVLGTKVPTATYAALERYAREKGISRSEFCRRFLEGPISDVLAGKDPFESLDVERADSDDRHD